MADDGFFEIYDAHHDGVRRFIQATLRDPWAADDLVQETFLRVIRKRDTLKEPSRLRPWIYSIAFNLCRDHLRRRAGASRPAQTDPETLPLLEQMPAPSSIEAALAGHQMNACLQHKLTLLPESLRTVLWLFDMEGMSQHDIAQVLDISIDNVKVRLHRARKRLKQILQTHCTFERDERDVLVCEPVRSDHLKHSKRGSVANTADPIHVESYRAIPASRIEHRKRAGARGVCPQHPSTPRSTEVNR